MPPEIHFHQLASHVPTDGGILLSVLYEYLGRKKKYNRIDAMFIRSILRVVLVPVDLLLQ